MVGDTYLERGRPVVVVAAWRGKLDLADLQTITVSSRGDAVRVVLNDGKPVSGPRNVLIRRDNGELVVRPFRGLRKPAPPPAARAARAEPIRVRATVKRKRRHS